MRKEKNRGNRGRAAGTGGQGAGTGGQGSGANGQKHTGGQGSATDGRRHLVGRRSAGGKKKTVGAVVGLLIAVIFLFARSGLFDAIGSGGPGFPGLGFGFFGLGGPPAASEHCGQSLDWRLVWESPEKYRGKTTAVSGKVVDAAYAPGIGGEPTFLNIGNEHPETPRFEIVIWGEERGDFLTSIPRAPEHYYSGRTICAAGTIELHEGIPQIVVSDPKQIILQEE